MKLADLKAGDLIPQSSRDCMWLVLEVGAINDTHLFLLKVLAFSEVFYTVRSFAYSADNAHNFIDFDVFSRIDMA